MKYDIYLAAPFFTQETKDRVAEVAGMLRAQGKEVYVPMEHEVEEAWNVPNSTWGKRVFRDDTFALRNSKCVIALINTFGTTEDGGTAWEIGYACGRGIPVYGYEMWSRVEETEPEDYVASLMILNSLKNIEEFDYVFQK